MIVASALVDALGPEGRDINALGRLVGELLKLVALPLDRAGEEDQSRRADEGEQPNRDDHEHLALLFSAHQYSSVPTVWESKVMVLGMPSSVLRTGFHWSFRSTTTSWAQAWCVA